MIRIGTAGWTIPAQLKPSFMGIGTHLERYARTFNCVEINSSFYRDHKPETYAKWAQCTPENFRFAVKLSKVFTHERRLLAPSADLERGLEGIRHLDYKWSILLIQFPPSLAFDFKTAAMFFRSLRRSYSGPAAFEPRHLTWSSPEAIETIKEYSLSRVLADPDPCPLPPQVSASEIGAAAGLIYYRLHGSPAIYKSRYAPAELKRVAGQLKRASPQFESWCIFDNTTFGFATENAIELMQNL
jgi:uncharacterized protein YecE (DUF72 family)